MSTRTQKTRQIAAQTAERMSRYAAALSRFAAGQEYPDDRATLAAGLDNDGHPCFRVAGLRKALRDRAQEIAQ